MIRSLVRLAIVLALAAGLVLPQASAGSGQEGLPPIMPLGEVRPGMRGIGRTVIQGQRVEQFDFEVIGILQGGGGIINVKHLILFRVFGPLMERTGGVAAGMSGSPLYVNGRLIGALSAGYIWQPGTRDLGLATPIEEMLPLLTDQGRPGADRRVERWPTVYRPLWPLRVAGRPVERVVVAWGSAAARAAALPGSLTFVPATTVSQVSGLTPRAFTLLRRILGDRSPRPLVQAGGTRAELQAERIRDGSTVGIVQVFGDITFGGICTVTLRVGNRLLICGHPWDQFGAVDYGLTASEIIQVVRTLERPFKEGNLGGLIGKIDQDRGQAIRGVLGELPRMFAVRVVVNDLDSGRQVTKGMQVVRREDLVRVFAPIMALTAVERARDQVIGEGTARVKMTVRAAGLPRVLERENVFYSDLDVAIAAMFDVPFATQFLFQNPFTQLNPIDMTIQVAITRQRQTATIQTVDVERREVSPGERLRVRITARPFQRNVQTTRVLEVPIPRNFPRGPAFLVVGPGGTQPPPSQAPSLGDAFVSMVVGEQEPFPGENLEEAIDIFENFGKNNHILLQVVPFGLPADGVEFTKFDVFAGGLVETDWVIQGQVTVPILVR
ncbi:MAG: SpoIVB peptidase S55 domain-containing protein [Armatimonadota bacterium]|nr:SpoIVB peptidase S55 domain-containing protein [Armatimonadota bacterium]MDR7449221.1 SpoIVB peptidase S55 domain-containing protein [Armatimonadota bacterium]MDR7459286.1 SpoIVB peptidase S55 domain-containing protein [Armatimonadota bacterium]MDR7478342.1 SpoIVB peptidase S55 domain-containing protein [Armatimonadota bacterium]MDR7487215.1 SpoIVB peptidase S55 domain-containing protein [Armatimonadota bacterium]